MMLSLPSWVEPHSLDAGARWSGAAAGEADGGGRRSDRIVARRALDSEQISIAAAAAADGEGPVSLA